MGMLYREVEKWHRNRMEIRHHIGCQKEKNRKVFDVRRHNPEAARGWMSKQNVELLQGFKDVTKTHGIALHCIVSHLWCMLASLGGCEIESMMSRMVL